MLKAAPERKIRLVDADESVMALADGYARSIEFSCSIGQDSKSVGLMLTISTMHQAVRFPSLRRCEKLRPLYSSIFICGDKLQTARDE